MTGWGQSTAPAPDWRHVGSAAVDLLLAAPATGPVDAVWFAPGGNRLYARTHSGKVFQTDDFDTWVPSAAPAPPISTVPAAAVRLPEAGARVVATPADPARIYALGRHLSRSDDGGRSWTNLTAFQSDSVVGGGQRGLAVSPADPEQMVLANDYGVWRTMDGGMSWAGLNQGLPNLPVRHIVATPARTGTRVWTETMGTLELAPGTSDWQPVPDAGMTAESLLRARYSASAGVELTAFAVAGDTIYAGSADGRIRLSFDGGRTFQLSRRETAGPVERIFADPAEPRVALAVLGGSGTHVLRTTNTGAFWDDLTANLPDVPVHGVTADRAANALYVATDRGVFYARADLTNAAPPDVFWVALAGRLPEAPAMDVRLDPAGNQLYVALDGYGVYAARAPHRARVLRVVSAADFSNRAAAPGSLLSVVGGRVDSARGNGLNYPVLAASDTDSQIQVPFEAAGPNVALALETRAGSVNVPLPVLPAAPAIFVGRDGAPMLLDADSELLLDGRTPLRPNTRIQIFTTGLGRVRPDWPTGLAAPLDNAPAVVAPVRVFLDRVPVPVLRATLAPGYIGFYVIEVQIPALVNAGQAELYVTAGGQESNRVQVALEP